MLKTLHAMLPKGRRPRVLVIGDLILDEYLRGRIHRISPEAPVPVLESMSRHAVPGGAANVATNLAALGCDVSLCGAVGKDARGDELIRLIEAHGVDSAGVLRVESRPTTHKLRVVAHQQQVVRIDEEVTTAVDSAIVAAALAFVHSADVDGIVCSDYLKGFVTTTLFESVVSSARERSLQVIVDPKGTQFARYRGVNALTPNLYELGQGVGVTIASDADRDHAAAKTLSLTNAQALLVTCGKDGMVLYQRDQDPVVIRGQAREVFDVTGAGDTVVAVFSLGLFGGVPLDQAARLANAAAGIVVGKLGTAVVSQDELESELGKARSTAVKVSSRDDVVRRVAHARAAGKKIVTTNGCFDLLHPGHVAFLEAARSFGDLLVVGLNSDASVTRLKGPTRPLLDEQSRARMLAAFACVDFVVVFDEPDPTALVQAICPDVHVKGADYRLADIIERSAVEAQGGRVELVPVVADWSTTGMVEAIAKRGGGK